MILSSNAFGILILGIITTFTARTTPSIVPLVNRSTAQSATASAPVVDLGYGRYQGYFDPEYGLNVFKGYGRRRPGDLLYRGRLTRMMQDSVRGSSNRQAALAGPSNASTFKEQQHHRGSNAAAALSTIRRRQNAGCLWLHYDGPQATWRKNPEFRICET